MHKRLPFKKKNLGWGKKRNLKSNYAYFQKKHLDDMTKKV